jgi:hypothetical protein
MIKININDREIDSRTELEECSGNCSSESFMKYCLAESID